MFWKDIEDIAEALQLEKQGVDPLSVRYTDLRDWIAALPDWEDDIHLSNEAKLEAIQMAWYELWQDEQQQ